MTKEPLPFILFQSAEGLLRHKSWKATLGKGEREGKMVGQAYQEWLTQREQKALAAGCDILIDSIFDDFTEIEDWETEGVVDSALASHLPSRYLSHYTPLFFRQFFVCIITVAWKLAQPQHLPLASVGEELAAWAIIHQAKAALEMESDSEDTEAIGNDFEQFIDNYFEDLDFLFLFDDAYDGIDKALAGKVTGMTSLSFQDWFRPFSDAPERVTHPYTFDA